MTNRFSDPAEACARQDDAPPYEPGRSPIELLIDKTWDTHDHDLQVYEVLVPEQCALICMYGRMYHVTVSEMESVEREEP